jgi:hypothetical protein
MANEIDRNILPEFLQTTFTLSLGAAYKSVEMMMKPQESFPKMFTEMKSLFEIPEDTPATLRGKAEAIAGNVMGKGATMVQEIQTAGKKFTDPE